jgi:hypothetical protein
MSIQHIIVATESFTSTNKRDVIISNSLYVTKLFQQGLKEDKISDDALKSYYVDYYLSHLQHGGFEDFLKNFSNRHKTLYYISAGLEAIKAKKHLKLFHKALTQYTEKTLNVEKLDLKFKKLEKKKGLLSFNHEWLTKHPQLLIMHNQNIETKIQEHIEKYKKDTRHVRIIKQLCEIIDEEFIEVTAGDSNNIYQKAWHFKTAQDFYYMIEKENVVTLFNSFTKQELTQARLVVNSTEKSTFSNFITKIMA